MVKKINLEDMEALAVRGKSEFRIAGELTIFSARYYSRRRAICYVQVLFQESGPDLQNILRQSYDYLTIMPKLRLTDDGRLI